MRFMRHDKAQRPENVGGCRQQHLPFCQRLLHQPELVVFEVTQTAMNEFGAGGGSMRGQVMLFAQHHLQAAAGSVACNTGAIDAPAYHQQVAIQLLVQRCHSLHW